MKKICKTCMLLLDCNKKPIKITKPNSTIVHYICSDKMSANNIKKPMRKIAGAKVKTDNKWAKLSKKLRKENPICEICNINNSTEVHHWLLHRHFLSHKYDVENLICVCHNCHSKENEGYELMKKDCQKIKGFSDSKCEEMTLKANTWHRRVEK